MGICSFRWDEVYLQLDSRSLFSNQNLLFVLANYYFFVFNTEMLDDVVTSSPFPKCHHSNAVINHSIHLRQWQMEKRQCEFGQEFYATKVRFSPSPCHHYHLVNYCANLFLTIYKVHIRLSLFSSEVFFFTGRTNGMMPLREVCKTFPNLCNKSKLIIFTNLKNFDKTKQFHTLSNCFNETQFSHHKASQSKISVIIKVSLNTKDYIKLRHYFERHIKLVDTVSLLNLEILVILYSGINSKQFQS